jgi:hypothetical protein
LIVSQRLQNELAFDQGEYMPDPAFDAGAIDRRELEEADRWTLGVLSAKRRLGIIVSHDIGVMPPRKEPESTWLIVRYGARCGRDAAGVAGRRK